MNERIMKTFPPYGIATEQLLGSALLGNSTDVPIVVSMRRQEMSAGNKPRVICVNHSTLTALCIKCFSISARKIMSF